MMVTSQRNTTTNWVGEENHRDTPTSRPLYALLYVCSPTTKLSFHTLSPLSKIPESSKYPEGEMNVTFLKSTLLSPHRGGWLMRVWSSARNDGHVTKGHDNKLSQRRESSWYTNILASLCPTLRLLTNSQILFSSTLLFRGHSRPKWPETLMFRQNHDDEHTLRSSISFPFRSKDCYVSMAHRSCALLSSGSSTSTSILPSQPQASIQLLCFFPLWRIILVKQNQVFLNMDHALEGCANL